MCNFCNNLISKRSVFLSAMTNYVLFKILLRKRENTVFTFGTPNETFGKNTQNTFKMSKKSYKILTEEFMESI